MLSPETFPSVPVFLSDDIENPVSVAAVPLRLVEYHLYSDINGWPKRPVNPGLAVDGSLQ